MYVFCVRRKQRTIKRSSPEGTWRCIVRIASMQTLNTERGGNNGKRLETFSS